jgi:ubiquitin carboxyl-terminal hydrolase 5/13
LAIVEEREEDKYEHLTVVKCWKCETTSGHELPEAVTHLKVCFNPILAFHGVRPLQIKTLVDGVMQSMSSGRQSQVKAWEEEFVACEHTLTLEQFATSIPASGKQSLSSQADASSHQFTRYRTGPLP